MLGFIVLSPAFGGPMKSSLDVYIPFRSEDNTPLRRRQRVTPSWVTVLHHVTIFTTIISFLFGFLSRSIILYPQIVGGVSLLFASSMTLYMHLTDRRLINQMAFLTEGDLVAWDHRTSELVVVDGANLEGVGDPGTWIVKKRFPLVPPEGDVIYDQRVGVRCHIDSLAKQQGFRAVRHPEKRFNGSATYDSWVYRIEPSKS